MNDEPIIVDKPVIPKKPNAANITHGLAQLGGGAKGEGGGGMLAGIENIFNAGVNYGAQQAIGNNSHSNQLESPTPLLLDKAINDNVDETNSDK